MSTDRLWGEEDVGTLSTEDSHWTLWTSPTCASGFLTSACSSFTSTHATGSCLCCSWVLSSTFSSFEKKTKKQKKPLQVLLWPECTSTYCYFSSIGSHSCCLGISRVSQFLEENSSTFEVRRFTLLVEWVWDNVKHLTSKTLFCSSLYEKYSPKPHRLKAP